MPNEGVLFPSRQVTRTDKFTITKYLTQLTLYVRRLHSFTDCPTGFREQPLTSIQAHWGLNKVRGDVKGLAGSNPVYWQELPQNSLISEK